MPHLSLCPCLGMLKSNLSLLLLQKQIHGMPHLHGALLHAWLFACAWPLIPQVHVYKHCPVLSLLPVSPTLPTQAACGTVSFVLPVHLCMPFPLWKEEDKNFGQFLGGQGLDIDIFPLPLCPAPLPFPSLPTYPLSPKSSSHHPPLPCLLTRLAENNLKHGNRVLCNVKLRALSPPHHPFHHTTSPATATCPTLPAHVPCTPPHTPPAFSPSPPPHTHLCCLTPSPIHAALYLRA